MHYVIGDVHGCLDELELLIDKIQIQDIDATFLFVGDWTDRGPKVWDTLKWVANNITPDGRFQSVRGNHDQYILEWYKSDYGIWLKTDRNRSIPDTYYGLNNIAETHMDELQVIEDYVHTVEAMPFNKAIKIGNTTFRICHAWHSNQLEGRDLNEVNIHQQIFNGNYENDEVIVHGHTPTFEPSFNAHNENDRPGMICYRHNAINIDGGCCFFKTHFKYVCMLSAVCLETLEEFYPYGVDERLMQGINSFMRVAEKNMTPEDALLYKQEMFSMNKSRYINKLEMDLYRKELLSKISG